AALQHALRHSGRDPVGRRGHPERAGQGGTAQVVRRSSEHAGSMQSSRVGCNPEIIGSSSCNGAEIAAACGYRRRWRGPEPGRRDVTIIVQTAGANQLALIAWGLAGVPPITMGIGPVPATADAMRRAGLRLVDDARGPLPTSMPSRSMCCVRMNRTDVAVSGPQLLAVANARVTPGSTDRGRADGGCRGGEQ